MTTPRASRTDRYGNRTYPVPDPTTRELVDLPAWSRLSKVLAAPGLEVWKLKATAKQVALNADLQMLAAEDDTTYDAVKQALDKAKSASNIGTAIHRYTELADKGQLDLDLVPSAARPFIEHYAKAQADHAWTTVEAEATVFNHSIGYAGTLDRIVDLPGIGRVVADVKTGAAVYAETALQLAAYANASGIWTAPADEDLAGFIVARDNLERVIASGTGFPKGRKKWSEAAKKEAWADVDEVYWEDFAAWQGHRPMPEGTRTDIGVVFHLTEHGCDVVVLDLATVVPALDVVRSLRTIWGWQQGSKSVVRGAPTDTGAPPSAGADDEAAGVVATPSPTPAADRDERRAHLIERLNNIHEVSPKAMQYLASIWPADLAALKKATTDEELDRIEWLIQRTEGHYQVLFEMGEAIAAVTAAFPGATVVDATEAKREMLAKRVAALAASRPDAVASFRAALESAGVAKSLRSDQWTSAELLAFESHLTIAEASQPTTNNQGATDNAA